MASRLESANAAQISQAMGFTETVTKSGYLVKRAKQSERNWKKRYFVLSGQSLTYYENNKKLTVAKGNFLLTNGTVVEPVTGDKSYDHCFEIRSEFETMRMAAASPEEAEEWTSALTSTIAEINSSTRAYMDVQEKGMFGNKWARRFVMLHSNSITYHQDHMHTFKALGTVKLTSEMVVIANEASLRVKEVHKARDEIHLRPSSEESDPTSILVTWKSAIEASVRGISEASDLAVKPGETNNEVTTIDGHLLAQTAKHKWVPRFFALTTTALYMAEDDKAMEALAVFPLSPSCSVFETNLRPNAFELVTPQGALHVAANDQESTKRWIAQFRHVIGNSKVSRNDPLLCGALNKEMSQYDVNFTTKKPLGIVLERSREWALVKLANSEVSDVSEGSALAKINGKSVLLTEYNKTIKMLAGWQPPLQLTFIRGPDKKGWLEKMSRGRRRAVKNWKRRYFILKQGKLAYYTMEGDVPELKGCVQLMGSAVSLIPFDEVGHNFCFRLVSGVATLVMRAETVEEMMDWATDLYHAIAIANGGGYLLEIQRKIEAKEEAERVRIAKEKAKVEAEERKHAAVEAERRRLEMEEAARREAEEAAIEQARLEAEEAARAASQAALEAENAQDKLQGLEDDLAEVEYENAELSEQEELVEQATEDVQMPGQSKPDEATGAGMPQNEEGASKSTAKAMDLLQLGVDDDDDDDDDHEGEGGAEDAGAFEGEESTEDDRRSSVATTAVGDLANVEPTDEEYERAFAMLDSTGTGALNPMQFSNLLRAAGVSIGNLHLEMHLYSLFDQDGQVGISAKDIKYGIEAIRGDSRVNDKMIEQLTNYVKELGSQDTENFVF